MNVRLQGIRDIVVVFLLSILGDVHVASATCGTFGRYQTKVTQQTSCSGIPFCSSTGYRLDCGGSVCGYSVSSNLLVYDCATGEYVFTANDSTGPLCPCDSADAAVIASRQDGAIKPGTYNCTEDCSTSAAEPEVCDGLDPGDSTPDSSDEACGDDEHGCSAGANDRDGAPVRFSSGRVETNPITLLSLPTPDGVFFGYRVKWGSHIQRGPALGREYNGYTGTPTNPVEPKIHHSEESTHFLGNGWLDDYSDRLYISVRNKQISDPPVNGNKITWQHRMGTVTFKYSGSSIWKSSGGKFELVDRSPTAPHTPPADGYGRWVVRTTDSTAPRRIWAFEEFTYVDYANFTFTMGRLRRHALLTSTLTNLDGRYGFTVTWSANGTISNASDSLGRKLTFNYSSFTQGGIRSLVGISYQPHSSVAATPIIEMKMTPDNSRLERVRRLDTTGYTRFLYYSNAPSSCLNCASLITAVIVPGPGNVSTPGPQAPIQGTEIAKEENWYGSSIGSSNRYVGVRSRYPGREYAYQHEVNKTTQFDLHQALGAACGSGSSCPTGYVCRLADSECYRAEVIEHDLDLKQPTHRSSGGGGGGGGNPMSGSRSYQTSGANVGAPRSSADASGLKTTYGLDSNARIRCIVRNDDDEEAFASPSQPDSSACAGPATAQVIRVDYTTTTITKTTPSLLGGNVTAVTALDATSLLPTSVTTTGNTKNVDGSVQSQTRITSTAYDTYGRVLETNGPLTDSVALDKVTTTYYTSFNPSWPYDLGQVSTVTSYVGTSSSSTPITTSYSEYDAFGVPHRVVGPNGQPTTFSPSSDRLTWTIRECAVGSGCIALPSPSVSTIVFNPEGSVRSWTDADGICTTYKYLDGSTYVGAPTRIRRAPDWDNCGADITDTLANSGEVELRTYANGEAERLLSITRRMDGTQEFTLGGFTYDRDRRLTGAPFENGGSLFSVLYTDVLQTGVVAPGAPSAGAWKTETTPDAFGRPDELNRFIDSSNTITHGLSYASPWSPRPTTLTRGQNGSAVSTSTFSYDDFGRLVEATVPEAGAPGSPAATRFEYDVGDRLTKKRVGVGTAMVRTDLRTYDSLGRVLSVDNDTEHPVTCGSAPSGTPIQDEEYKYDVCPSPDVPSGFSCGNALGRLTIARSIVQCGTSSAVKRGRWYDYDDQGRVKRVAYATVTGSSVGAPAISSRTYSAGGRMESIGSPINAAYGTNYDFTVGRVTGVNRTTGAQIVWDGAYLPFGPLKSFKTFSQLNSGGSVRYLTWEGSAATNYVPSGFAWTFKTSSGPGPDIALLNQTFVRSSSGLLQTRTDTASSVHSRDYSYDALARLVRERMIVGTATWLKGVFTFGNGQNMTTPADARVTSSLRAGDVNALLLSDGDGYVSQAVETTTYASGSTQPQGITRANGGLVYVHDALGRRTSDYDANEPTTSRRDYTYLPNGQLGSVYSPSSHRSYSIRYDEDGHQVTISEYDEYVGSVLRNTYELFWDEDRLIAAQIVFAADRPEAQEWPCVWDECVSYSSVRWNYHYLGETIVGATRERIHSDGTVFAKLFWFLTDERGLVHRVVDAQGATSWQAQWDAHGGRSWIGYAQAEMWIPFGLPGQIILGDSNIEQYYTNVSRIPGSEATIKPTLTASASSVEGNVWNYRAEAAADKSLSTRWSSAASDPQWIMLDLGAVKPLSGVRLTWETAFADGYRIETANSSNGPWTTVYATSGGDGNVDEISFSASARYVRMYGTHRATSWGYSLWEFEVFGPWTRPAIALNQWRAYDPLSSSFLVPDAADLMARSWPETYVAFRSNSLRFWDPDGMSSREEHWLPAQAYKIDSTCVLAGRDGQIMNALTMALVEMEKCNVQDCGDDLFRRKTLFAMSTGTYYCVAPSSSLSLQVGYRKRTWSDDGTGYLERFDEYGTTRRKRNGAWAETLMDYGDLIPQRRVILGPASRECLKRQLAHEGMHSAYGTTFRIGEYDPAYLSFMRPVSRGSMEDNGNMHTQERIYGVIERCVSCP